MKEDSICFTVETMISVKLMPCGERTGRLWLRVVEGDELGNGALGRSRATGRD